MQSNSAQQEMSKVETNMSKALELPSKVDVEHEESPETRAHDDNLKLHLQDVGAKYATAVDEVEFTKAAQRRYLRRIDLVLMPILFISWGLQYADKSILNSAAQFGIVEDLDLATVVVVNGKPTASLKRFSYAVMMFYWGYFAGGETEISC
jgi:hypothetical protein